MSDAGRPGRGAGRGYLELLSGVDHRKRQRYQFVHDSTQLTHEFDLTWESCEPVLPEGTGLLITATCVRGHAVGAGTKVSTLIVSHDLDPIGNASAGMIGDGQIHVHDAVRGMGLGTLIMCYAVAWLRSQKEVPFVPITLSVEHADVNNLERRARFYRKFGIRFKGDDGALPVHGDSEPMNTHQLLIPDQIPAYGWSMSPDFSAPSRF